jgi:hypothetical protein
MGTGPQGKAGKLGKDYGLVSLFQHLLKHPKIMKVIIKIGNFKEVIGVLEDKIPNSDWFNVRISPNLRLALTEKEFDIIW